MRPDVSMWVFVEVQMKPTASDLQVFVRVLDESGHLASANRNPKGPRHAEHALGSIAEFGSQPAAVLRCLPLVRVAVDSEVGRVEGLDQLRGQAALLGVLPERIVRAPGIEDVPRVQPTRV